MLFTAKTKQSREKTNDNEILNYRGLKTFELCQPGQLKMKKLWLFFHQGSVGEGHSDEEWAKKSEFVICLEYILAGRYWKKLEDHRFEESMSFQRGFMK